MRFDVAVLFYSIVLSQIQNCTPEIPVIYTDIRVRTDSKNSRIPLSSNATANASDRSIIGEGFRDA